MSTEGKVVHEVDRWGGGRRYVVEFIGDIGGYRWEFHRATDDLSVAIVWAEALVQEGKAWQAHVVDTEAEEGES